MVNNIPGGSNAAQHQAQASQQVQVVVGNEQQGVESTLQVEGSNRSEGIASIEDIRNAVTELNSRLEDQQIQVNFDVDDDTGRIVVKVKDIDSGEVIRQIPSEATLEFAHNARKGVGVTLDGTF